MIYELKKKLPPVKRAALGILFALWAVSFIPAQQNPVDLILVLDTSIGMSDFQGDVGNYITGPFLRDNLHIGDTFHLISFSGTPRLEVVRRVEGFGDVETIIGRMLLLYPLNPTSDLSRALDFTERHVRSLPGTRQKKVVIVSNGNPGLSADTLQKLIADTDSRLSRIGATIRLIRAADTRIAAASQPRPQTAATAVPPASSAAAAPASPVRPPAAAPGAPPARPQTAATAAPPASSAAAPASPARPPAAAPGAPPARPQTAAPAVPPASSAAAPASPARPPAAAPGAPPARPQTAAPAAPPVVSQPSIDKTADDGGGVRGSYSGSTGGGEQGPMLPLLIVLGIVAVLGLGFLSFFMVRRLHGSPNRVMAAASTSPLQGAVRDDSASRNAELLDSFASRPKTASRPLYRRKDTEAGPFSNPPLLSLFVEDQNTAIGRRNIHILKAGNTFSVGGGSSDFLIFLVSIPRRIGEIRFDGSQCTFTPLKTKYFPDIGSEKVSNCVGKTIRIISDKNYELFFHFEQYRDPLIVLNRLLHSIDVPKE